MKENSTLKKLTKGKKLLFILAPACALVLAGGIVTATVLSSGSGDSSQTDDNIDVIAPTDGDTDDVDTNVNGDADTDNTDTDVNGNTDGADTDVNGDDVTVFCNPLKDMNIIHTFGFYYNSTLNSYYEHGGVDVSADEGSEVYATTDGTVTSVYTGDVLTGNRITVDNGGGIVTVYSFVDPVEGLAAGSAVKKGDVIATVSAATGGEYKDGAHVHLEVYLNGTAVDPENYLTDTQK